MGARGGRKLDAAGRELVKKWIIGGHTGEYIRRELVARGYPEISRNAIKDLRNKPDVQTQIQLLRQDVMQEGMADARQMVRFYQESIWLFRHKMNGREPDPDYPERALPGERQKVTSKDLVRYSEQARKYAQGLIRLLHLTSVNITDVHPDGATSAAIDNLLNDMLERYVAEQRGISVQEVRYLVDQKMQKQDQEQRLLAARPAGAEVTNA